MHAFVLNITTKQRSWDDVRGAVDTLCASLEGNGCRRFLFLGEPATGTGIVITLWDDPVTVDMVSEDAMVQLFQTAFAARDSVIPASNAYEVVEADLPSGASTLRRSGLYGRVTHVALRSDQLDEAMGLVTGCLLPSARDEAGYRGFLFLLDRASGQSLEVTFWDSTRHLLSADRDMGFFHREMATGRRAWASPSVTTMYTEALVTLGQTHDAVALA